MGIMVDYYKILDVPQSASMNDIKRAYRSKVLRWHPDKNPENRKEAEQKFKEIVEAYKILSDKNTRDHYDGSSKDTFKEAKKAEAEKHLSVFDQDGIKIFFTGKRSSSDFSVSFFSAPKRFHHFSIMTAIINGKKITTKRHLENESKYLEVEEDGKTVSIHVNGIPVYDREINRGTGNEWDYRPDKGHYCPNKWSFWTCERRRWADEWRRWANKWRDWAEECRDWAEGRHPQEEKGSSGAHGRHSQANTSKGREQQHKADKSSCPKSGGKIPGFPMPGEGKCDLKEAHSRTNKGQCQPDEESPRTDKEYFVFPKPGERSCGVHEGHLKTNKRQHRPEEGPPLADRSNPGYPKPGEGHVEQEEGHSRTKKRQPKPEEGQSRRDKVAHGLEKPAQGSLDPLKIDPRCHVFPMKHKTASECSSQVGSRELHVEKHGEPRAGENDPYVVKGEKLLGTKDEKLELKCEKGGSTLDSEPEKRTELNGMLFNSSTDTKPDLQRPMTFCSASGQPLKSKELQNRTRRLHSRRSKSQAGRNRSYTSRSRSQARKNRMLNDHHRESEGNDPSNGGGEVLSELKKTPAHCKSPPKSKKKGPLPTIQVSEIPLHTKKRLLRRRTHQVTPETPNEKHQPVSESSQFLDINGQRRGRLMKTPHPSAQLPNIQGQKLGMNHIPNVTH
ncbi:dnaJ homolog subfamily C member 21-like isoform X2 [Sceloporus undulatus]|uniref:dnaJ homolog subfamily C member 21-like isoform X2 n=1 Tax=Sceloporus undulatus TaxID=8520 RepID=UPI001C4D59D7|nr:dnaJ homolog subfamily C member 21-like isoform X2 [Sceloporus undulatus]